MDTPEVALKRPLRGLAPAAVGVLAVSLLSPACEAPEPAGLEWLDVGLLQVVGITLVSINEHYPERPPTAALNSLICHVDLDVQTLMPDECTAFSEFTGPFIEGNTISFTIHGARRRASGYCGGPVVSNFGLCLPGLGAEPPPPALPPGHYVVIANGFTGGFDIP